MHYKQCIIHNAIYTTREMLCMKINTWLNEMHGIQYMKYIVWDTMHGKQHKAFNAWNTMHVIQYAEYNACSTMHEI